MQQFTRRTILQMLSATTLCTLAGCKQRKRTFTIVDHSTLAPPDTLNVVIMGLCAIVVDTKTATPETGITVVFPDIVDPSTPSMSHLYWYGNIVDLSNEETSELHPICTNATFSLEGVPPVKPLPLVESNYLNNGKDIVFDNISVNQPNQRIFQLPWPKDLQSFGLAHRKDGQPLLQDNTGTGRFSQLQTIATTHVLTYPLDQNKTPKVTCDGMDTSWIADSQYADDATHANLHIFAEPRTANPDHARNAFDKLIGTTLGVNGLSFKPFQDGDMAPITDTRGGGLRLLDFDHLEKLTRGGEVANCVSALVFK